MGEVEPTVQDSVVTGDLHVGDVHHNIQNTNVDNSTKVELPSLDDVGDKVVKVATSVFDFVKDIQTAIDGDRLELFYQPIYAAAGRGNNREDKKCELSVGVRNKDELMMPRSELAE